MCCASRFNRSSEKGIRQVPPPVFLAIKNAEVFTDDLAILITLDLFRAAVPVLNLSVFVEQDDSIVLNLVDHFVVTLFTALEHLKLHLQYFGALMNQAFELVGF